MTIASLYNRRNELKAEIETMAGRKGISALRSELEQINARLRALDARRVQMKNNVNSQNASKRSEYHVEQMRATLDALAKSTIKRGIYQELIAKFSDYSPQYYMSGAMPLAIARKCPTHPNVRPFAGYLQALNTLAAAVADGVIEHTDAEFDKKGRGTATNHDLYSYSHDGTLILVQVRHAEVTKYGTNVRIQYFVTDGDDAIEIEKGKANIKKAAQADPSPDSPLRFLRNQLKAEWRAKLDEKPVKLLAPQVSQYTVYKILHDDNGILRSVYSGEDYTVGKQKMQKAQDEHNGGYYAFLSAEDAQRVHQSGKTFNREWIEGKSLVLCKGRAFGRPVSYSNGKRAFSRLVIDEIVSAI